MKLTTCLLLVTSLHVAANTYSQKVTIQGKKLPLSRVFSLISKQTGLDFVYEKKLLRDITVDLDVRDADVSHVLKDCMQDQRLDFTIVDNTIVISPWIAGPGKSLSPPGADSVYTPPLHIGGTVTDTAGKPLAGASITVKGLRTATTTDDNGQFTLDVPDGATLIISYLGYSNKEVKVHSQANLRIALSVNATGLDMAVIIGYGTVKRRDLTGSVAIVKGNDITAAPVASADQALQGKAAGVQVTSTSGMPGSGTTIRIRGGNSISSSNEPLYVIDGFIWTGSALTSFNPADIQSMEILKDASATAIYGARGANGVILITTKRGRPGKTNVSAGAYYGFQQLPREVALLNGPQLADFVNERAALYGAAPIYPDVSKVTTTDWQKAITRTAPMQNADVSVSGGSDKSTYYLSANYFNQDGIILNSGFQRYQTRLNLELKLTKWLTFGTNLNFTRSNSNNNKVNLYDILKSGPTSQPVLDTAGHYTIVSALSGQTFENPVAVAKMTLNNTYDNSLLGNWYLQAAIANGLQLRSTLSVNNDNIKGASYQPGSLPLRSTQKVGGYASLSSTQVFNLLNENTISYDHVIGEHHVNLLGGFTYQHENSQNFTAVGQGYTNDLLTYNNLATGTPSLAQNTSTATQWTIISFLGRLNYSYKDRYLLTASARQDGSSRLSANNKWAFFPSAAFAWKMSEEDFIRPLTWLSNLKFRMSYGRTGNQAVGVYSTLASLTVTNAFFNGAQQTGYTLGNIPNDNLKWETTDQYNAGIDAGFLGGRFNVTVDAYYKKTFNLLLTAQIPGTTGYSSRLENIGSVENKGLELSVDGVLIDKKDIRWDLSANISANRNKVLDLGPGLKFRDVADGVRLIVGQPAPVFYGAVYQGTYKTQAEVDAVPNHPAGLLPGFPKFKDVNGNKQYDGAADYAVLGNPQPKFFGGFSSTFRYHRLSLSAYFEYSYGNKVINSFGPRLFMGEYASNVAAQEVNRWKPTNDQSNLPRVGSYTIYSVNTQAYSFAVQDGSFLRLKTLQLSYDLTPVRAKWLQGASIYVTGSNLFLLNHYTWGYDPEVNSSGTDPILRGMDGYSYPQNRSFIAGINLKF